MSEEEKKAIEYFKKHIIPVYGRKGQIEYLLNDIILNLIDKQQKEIEELKENQIWSEATIEGLKTDFIHKDKIREKIKEINKDELLQKIDFGQISLAIKVLYELLEEK